MLPLPWFLHDTNLVLHAQHDAQDVRVERCSERLGGLIDNRTDSSLGARVVHRDIEAPEACDSLVDHRANVVVLADVGVDELGLCAERAQFLGECGTGLVTSASDDHVRALLGEGDGGGAADAGECTGDQNDRLFPCACSCV